MNATLSIVHFMCGLIVLAEALNKLERVDLFDGKQGWLPRIAGLGWVLTPWRWKRARVVKVFKTIGWALMSVGGGGAVVTPFMQLQRPTLQDVAVIAGFAILIIRSRLREGVCTEQITAWPPLS